MSSDNLHAALKALNSNENPGFDQTQDFLKLVRENRVPMPEHVYKYGSHILKRFSGKLGVDELWALREEVAIAALEIGKPREAWLLVDQIQRQFPDSTRASRLLAMHFEATKDYSKAEELYKKELAKDPANAALLRRLAALKESQGDLAGAISAIKSLLDTHSTDWISWEYAASLYLRAGAYGQAIFCLEEVLLHQPGNVNGILLLADTLYSAGGSANWEAAKGYYSGIVEITGGENARALYGLTACAAQLNTSRQQRSGGEDLGGLAGEALRQGYAVKNSEKLGLVDAMLKSQGVM